MARAHADPRTFTHRPWIAVGVLVTLLSLLLWVLLGYRSATIDLDVLILELVATVLVAASACLAPTRPARRALSLFCLYALLTLAGDSYWLLTVDPTGLSYLDGDFEPGFTVMVELVRYAALIAMLAQVWPHATTRPEPCRWTAHWWPPPARAAVARWQITTATAALAMALTPLGTAVDDGDSYSLFCFFDVLVLAIAAGTFATTAGAQSGGRPDAAARRRAIATAIGTSGLVLGDAGIVISLTRDWVVGGALSLVSEVGGACALMAANLLFRGTPAPAVTALPPLPRRTPGALPVATTLLVQNVLPVVIAAVTWARIVGDEAETPGPATLGAAAAALVLSLVHAGLQARDAWWDGHKAVAANRDEVTGAYTRRGLVEFADRFVAPDPPVAELPRQRSRVSGDDPHPSPGSRWSVALLDLDGFKAVNDTHGHDAGDDVLRTVAHRVAALVDGHGVVARFGGDEFVLLLHTPETVARPGAERIQHAVREPVRLAGEATVSVGCSIGVATVEPTGEDVLSTALRLADERMYAQKRRRRR